MTESFNYVFQYLEKEGIHIDKTEFLFQIQSHPDYPSVLSVADSLTFFNIPNGVGRVSDLEIEILPERFVALLREENNEPKFYYIEQKEHYYLVTKDKKNIEISKSSLESKWNGVVLLVENEPTPITNVNKSNLFWIFPSLLLFLFSSLLWLSRESIQVNFFFVFTIIGVMLSIAAFKDLFDAKSDLINSFCNISASANCTSVIGSDKWKIFEIVNFSDLSMVFFTSQLLNLLAFFFISNISACFGIQKLLLIMAIPVLFASVYYQKFVEKKWCPICLLISVIIILELSYMFFLPIANHNILIHDFLVFGFVFVAAVLGWLTLKKVLLQQKELKEFQFKANRFYRNYENFKTILISKGIKNLVSSPFVFGNPTSKTQITIITNPFCGHCEKAHHLLDDILDKNNLDLCINFIINVDLSRADDVNKLFYRNLMNIYLQKGSLAFRAAFHAWFKTKNIENWLRTYQTLLIDAVEIDAQYDKQGKWCRENDLNFTPAIFINGYPYPNSYERDALPYFINELIRDKEY